MTDTEIVQLVIAGNRDAFRPLAEKYKGMVFRTSMGFVHNKEDAEDITQDVLVSVYQSLGKFKGQSSFSTWVYRIALNASLNFVRKKSRHSILQRFETLLGFEKKNEIQQIESGYFNPEQILTNKERRASIHRALDLLPENQCIAFTLSKYDDLPQREIAQIMNLTEGAVEALLQRAKANLQKKLSDFYNKKTNTHRKI
ncbi:MAG: RNA polymerase sigma factor [Bacteroidales bacterium]